MSLYRVGKALTVVANVGLCFCKHIPEHLIYLLLSKELHYLLDTEFPVITSALRHDDEMLVHFGLLNDCVVSLNEYESCQVYALYLLALMANLFPL